MKRKTRTKDRNMKKAFVLILGILILGIAIAVAVPNTVDPDCLLKHYSDDKCPQKAELEICKRFGGVESIENVTDGPQNYVNVDLLSTTIALQAAYMQTSYTQKNETVGTDVWDIFEKRYSVAYYIAPISGDVKYNLTFFDFNNNEYSVSLPKTGDINPIPKGEQAVKYDIITYEVKELRDPIRPFYEQFNEEFAKAEEENGLRYVHLVVEEAGGITKHIFYEFCGANETSTACRVCYDTVENNCKSKMTS